MYIITYPFNVLILDLHKNFNSFKNVSDVCERSLATVADHR